MTQPLPPLTKDLIEAFAASAGLWLARLLGVWFAPHAARRQRRLLRFVRRIERAVECIIFLMAVQRFGPAPRRRRRPPSTPPGFRRTQGNMRLFWKSARIRARNANLIGRVVRLLEALAHPTPYIARFMKRLIKGLRLTHLVPAAPPAVTLSIDAPRTVAFADSS